MGRKAFTLASFALFALTHDGLAAPSDPLIPGSRYQSAVAAAMGEAYLPLNEDVSAGLFYNPAGLGRVLSPTYEVVNFSFFGNTTYFGKLGTTTYDPTSLSSSNSVISNSGKMSGTGAQFVSAVGFPLFSFGILASTELGSMTNADSSLSYRSLYQIIPTVGRGWSFYGGIVRIGYSLQWVNKAQGSPTVTAADTLGYNQYLNQGSGFSHNAGIEFAVPLSLLPTASIVVRNIAGVHYSSFNMYSFSPSSVGTPASEKMTVDLAMSIHPRPRGAQLHFVIEGRDMTNTTGTLVINHFSAGAEWGMGGKFFLRAGARGVQPSGGMGWRNKKSEMSMTFYTEKLETLLSDSRILFQYLIRSF